MNNRDTSENATDRPRLPWGGFGLTRIRGHSIWLTPLSSGSVVVDAGAHKGQFSQILHAATGARCLLIEANPDLARNCQVPEGCSLLAAGLASFDGDTTFIGNENPEMGSIAVTSNETQGQRIETVSLEALLRRNRWENIDLLKLDIEGQEFDVIAKTPLSILKKIGQITIEFHDFLPQFGKGNLYQSATKRLREAGFSCLPMSFRMHSDILFINTRFPSLERAPIRRMALFGKWVLKCSERWNCYLTPRN
jgi:FkbM family methyltransferase